MSIAINYYKKMSNKIIILVLFFIQMQFAYAQIVFNGYMAEGYISDADNKFTDYKNCDNDNYANPRIYMEAQSWWTPTPGYPHTTNPHTNKPINDFGHVHVGTCFPYKQTITTNELEQGQLMEFEVLLTFHSYPLGSKFIFIRPHIYDRTKIDVQGTEHGILGTAPGNFVNPTVWFDDYDGTGGLKLNNGVIVGNNTSDPIDVNALCDANGRVETHNHNNPVTPNKTCTIALNLKLDVSKVKLDGLLEFRFLTVLKEPDEFEMHTSNSWRANLDIGNTLESTNNDDHIGGRGWYSGSNYISSRVYGDQNFGTSSTNNTGIPSLAEPLDPTIPSRNQWSPEVSAIDGGSFGARISLGEVYINPTFHDGIDNDPLEYDEPGDSMENFAFKKHPLTIHGDTSGIKNGWNRLVVITHADCEVDNENDMPDHSQVNPDDNVLTDDCQCNDKDANSNCALPGSPDFINFGEFAGQRSSGILVVPFYAQNIPTNSGDACGDPGYDRTTERELFIWQDCAGDGTWYVRATAGNGPGLTYAGDLTSDQNQNFSNVIPFSIEASDTLDNSVSNVIDFVLNVGSPWHDGFNFQVPQGNTCLALDAPTGITVKAGANRTPVNSPFDIHTLESCQTSGPAIISIEESVAASEPTNMAQEEIEIEVTWNKPVSEVIKLVYSTQDGTATYTDDYGYVTNSSGSNNQYEVSISPNEAPGTPKAIKVRIKDDSGNNDGTEEFTVKLIGLTNAQNNPTNAAIIGNGTSTITID